MDAVVNAQTAQKIRRDIVQMIHKAGSGHPGGSLSCVEILLSLYGRVMRYDPKKPGWPDRDRFLLSKGHAAPAFYAVLAYCGFFPEEALSTLRMPGSILQGHPDMRKTPGVDFSSGSLGQGLSVGLGMAEALGHRGSPARVYVLLGDGELDEGQVWEAAMAANKYHVSNLTAIVDRNCVQLDGTGDEIMPLEPLADKWRAFGWEVLSADGHDMDAMTGALLQARHSERPSVVIARTVKGKGVPFMEGRFEWHGGVMNEAQFAQAMNALSGGDPHE